MYSFSYLEPVCCWELLACKWEKAMAPHSSTLAWKIPWMEEPGRLQSMGLRRVRHDFTFTFTFHFHALEKEMATHSSVLAWRIQGMGEPGGLLSGRWRQEACFHTARPPAQLLQCEKRREPDVEARGRQRRDSLWRERKQ